ncbi:glycosyltransferase [Heyndrickxia oleronia]|uniref:glycosyltransferase n=1 Tax=Heyndrickxia oleronia TaxID=38875 RepID=UPI002042488B|nr:glycosyltransferase [Heyndrickxia oleronia]MCM3453728.1 glycosyltransferase [Heyndrickxia oleronia]
MQKINLSIVIPSLDTGGAESMAYQLAKKIDKDIFNLNFICLYSSNGTPFEKELINSGVNITHLNKKLGFSLITFLRLWKQLKIHHSNLVHTHLGACLYAFPWTLFHNKKLVHTVHNVPLKELPFLHRIILKILYRSKKAIPIAISDTIQRQISTYYQLKTENIQVVYNPVNTDLFIPSKTTVNNGGIKFICVARLVNQKNHFTLLKAFSVVNKKIPTSTLLLAGDGELMEELKKAAIKLNISKHVVFLGNVENIPMLLQTSDIFVLSSIYEGLPMTILEAMGAKLPVIATRVGGLPDIVKGNGILVEPNDSNGLASAMIQLAGDKHLRQKMGCLGFEMSKKYDISIIANQYEAIYKKFSL